MPLQLARTSPLCRCQALNRAGTPCGITSDSKALDARGKLAAAPLLRGGSRCGFHARWFCTAPLEQGELKTPPLLVYIDLESTGLSLATDEIVEIGLWADASHAAFSTVVRPAALPKDAGIHGISPEELLEGPPFAEAFRRMVLFLTNLAEAALSDDGSSSEESASELPRLRSDMPFLLLAAHNGHRFDFGMIVSQCWRCNVPAAVLATWLYVDTLDVLKVAEDSGACLKLQCQRLRRGIRAHALAHRALDDCVTLAGIMQGVAERLGQRPCDLLTRFAVKVDLVATATELSCLLE
jgi:DNA polymerase III epsilon subunit-like protein